MDLGVAGKQIEVIRIATGKNVHVEVVAESGGGGSGVVFVRGGELNEGLAGVGVDDGALLNPADLVLLGFDLEKTAVALEDLERLAVDDFSDALRDGGDAVVEIHVARSDVDGVVFWLAETAATRDQPQEA